jgi:hypothetical protein
MRRVCALAVLVCILLDHSLAQSSLHSQSVDQHRQSLSPDRQTSAGQDDQEVGGASHRMPDPSKQEVDLLAAAMARRTGSATVVIDEQYWADSFFAALSAGVMAIAGFGRCNHNHSTAAAYRRPLGGTNLRDG